MIAISRVLKIKLTLIIGYLPFGSISGGARVGFRIRIRSDFPAGILSERGFVTKGGFFAKVKPFVFCVIVFKGFKVLKILEYDFEITLKRARGSL